MSRMFQELGALLIDADQVARQVVEPGTAAWQEVVEHFGSKILLPNHHINRQKLGALIFHQTEEREILNRIVHPRVIQEIDRQKQELFHQNPDRFILVDVPLLIEATMHTAYEFVILIYTPEAVQLERLKARDNISEQDALARIRSQMPLEEKRRYATHIIDNACSLEQTHEQVVTVYQEISGRTARPVHPTKGS